MTLFDTFTPTQAKQLAKHRKARALELARTHLQELRRQDLTFGRFCITSNTGDQFFVVRGVVDEPHASSAVACYLDAKGETVYLQPAR